MICKKCKLNVVWKTTMISQKKVVVDHLRRPWKGRYCPDCSLIKKKKEPKDLDTNISNEPFEANPLTNRKCRKCGTRLHQSNYFNCFSCLDGVEEPYGVYEYGGMVISFF